MTFTDSDDIASYKLLLKWCFMDALLLWTLPLLRIPRSLIHTPP